MANIAKIELGDTTYDIKDAVVRPKIDAITAEDTDGNTYVKTSRLIVDGDSNFNGTIALSGSNEFTIKSENLDRDTTQTIAETQWGSKIRFTDNNNESLGYIEPFQRPSGTTGLRIISWNEKSDESTAWNSLTLEVAKDGTASYSISNPAAFRTAIGAVSKTGDTITGTVKFVHNNLTRSATITSSTDGTTKLEFYDKNNNLMNFITSHKNPDGTNYTRLTTYSPNGQQTTSLYLGNDGTRKRIGTDAKWTSSIHMESNDLGYWCVDNTGTEYPALTDNGTNLWIGANSSSKRQHVGGTYISSGYDGTKGNETIYVAVPNAANTGAQGYEVYHSGHKPTPAAIGAASTNADGAINTMASTENQQWYVRGKINNSSSSINGHYTWLVMYNWGISCWDATAQKTLWTTYTEKNLPESSVGTLSYGNIYRYGKMRILKIDTDETNYNLNSSWSNMVLGTLEAKDRPIINTDGLASMKNVGGNVTIGLQITTDGKIHLLGLGGTPAGNHPIWGQVVYLVA